jgi:hypothetical protein
MVGFPIVCEATASVCLQQQFKAETPPPFTVNAPVQDCCVFSCVLQPVFSTDMHSTNTVQLHSATPVPPQWLRGWLACTSSRASVQ